MGLAVYTFYLNNAEATPTNWMELDTLSNFVVKDDFDVRISESVQANITLDTFTFVNEHAQTLINYRKGGLNQTTNGILEGLPFRIEVNDGTTTSILFNGFINFKDGYNEISPVKVECRVKQLEDLNTLDDFVRTTTFQYLESIGVYKQSDYVDVPFIVEPLDAEAQLAALELALALYAIQAFQLIKEIGKDVANLIAHLTGGITGIAAAAIYAAVILLLDILFLGVLFIQMLNLLIRMIELIAPPVQFHKGIKLNTLFEKAFNHFGFGFDTGIEEMDKVVYLGFKGAGEGLIRSGIPKIGEPLQTVSDAMQAVLRTFNGRTGIFDGNVQIRTEADTFWIKNSTFKLPNVGNSDSAAIDLESEQFLSNINDFVSSTFVGFNSDPSEQWTTVDDEGIDVQVTREPKTVSNSRMLLFNGFEEILIPVALGSRKSVLSDAELVLEKLQTALKSVIVQINPIIANQIGANLSNVTGGNTTPNSTIFNYLNATTRVGALRISSKSYSVPKFLYMEETAEGFRIPRNHREKFSALAMYNKYHVSSSFAEQNNFGGQRLLFEGREIPLTYQDWLKVNNNSYFSTDDGETAKIESIKWKLNGDTAIVDYWIQQIWTKNVKEVVISTT